MPSLTLENISKVSLLCSDRWLLHLLSSEQKVDFDKVANQGLLDYLNYNHRRDDIESALGLVYNKNSGACYSLEFIEVWKNRFLEWKNDSFQVKPAYIDEWQEICGAVDPLLLLGWSYAEKIKGGGNLLDKNNESNQCPQALIAEGKIYADNHAHLGGHGSHRKALMDFIFTPHTIDSKKVKWPTLREFSYINSGQIESKELPRLLHAQFCYLVESVLSINTTGISRTAPSFDDILSQRYSNPSLRQLIKLGDPKTPFIKIMQQALKVKEDTSCLCIFTVLFYAERYLSVNHDWRRVFRAFIHTSQILRSSSIHRGVGLGYFVEFFGHKARKGINEKNYGKYAFSHDFSKNVFREFKVSPSQANQKVLTDMAMKLKLKSMEGNAQLCLHFTRAGNPFDHLQREKRLELKQEAERLIRLFSSVAMQNYVPKNKEGKPEKLYLNLLNLVRGLDIAGNENDLRVEVFAPVLRLLRSCPWKNSHPSYKQSKRPHFSIHCGEDFKHLISGLRHIDETVTFCGMENGDRLGHALALGVNPKLWAKRQGTVLLSVGEHLDNLVWLHHMANEVSPHLSTKKHTKSFEVFINKVATRIIKWSRIIYGRDITPNTLYESWELRRNCPITHLKIGHSEMNAITELIPDFRVEYSTDAVKLWQHYYFSYQAAQNRSEENKYSNIITIKHVVANHPDAVTKSNDMSDYFTFEELDHIEAIQDYLMTKYNKEGISIEACPSSNVFIGYFDGYQEHPIYRWNPPNPTTLMNEASNNRYGLRTGPINVCINTDDAGLFPTTIANEHRVIKETAIKCFATTELSAEKWIGKIRQLGIDEFNKNKEPLIV